MRSHRPPDARALATQLEQRLCSAPAEFVAAYLFGSYGRGTPNSDSDVDLGVLVREPLLQGLDVLYLSFEDDLRELLKREVQLVVLNRAPADLLHRVFKDGRIVLDRDRDVRIRFEVRRRSEYLDLVPFLLRYRRFTPSPKEKS